MKILKMCMTCFKESKNTSAGLGYVTFRDDGLYETTCDQNHVEITIVQEEKFEVLPEIAVQAIVDGYYREAIASFTAGMERFFEFYVRLITQVRGVSDQEYSAAWKTMAKQSERQLGAYIATYLTEEGTHPALLPNKQIELRNTVVHQGKIASREEAIAFGNEVLAVVNSSLDTLMAKHRNEVHAEVRRLLLQRAQTAPTGKQIQTMTIPTVISIVNTGRKETIEAAVTRVTEMRKKYPQRSI